MKDGRLLGVMDIDSPQPGRFDEEDARGLATLCQALTACTDWDRPLL